MRDLPSPCPASRLRDCLIIVLTAVMSLSSLDAFDDARSLKLLDRMHKAFSGMQTSRLLLLHLGLAASSESSEARMSPAPRPSRRGFGPRPGGGRSPGEMGCAKSQRRPREPPELGSDRETRAAVTSVENGTRSRDRTEGSRRVIRWDDLTPDQGSGTSLNSNSSGIVITLLGVS